MRGVGTPTTIAGGGTSMSRFALASILGCALVLAALPTFAHHSFSAQFDAKKPLKMTGTVTSVEWQNPHSWFYIDVKDAAGKVTNWGWELASPNLLLRNGWTRTTLEVGDVVTVEGYHAHNGSNIGNARIIVLTSTGETLLRGSVQAGGSQ
jgi:hypothetical protein